MTELLTSAQMRAIEQAAIAGGAVTGLELMERAGRGVVAAVFAQWPELAAVPHRAVVLCGPGNNGGDGFVVARLLKDWGWEVAVFLYGDPDRLPPDARANYQRWCGQGAVAPVSDDMFAGFPGDAPETALVVDALFGTGLSRPFLDLRQMQIALNACATQSLHDPAVPRVVSVDMPSGWCADSGRYPGAAQPLNRAIRANLTVSFHAEKLGHRLDQAPLACGRVVVQPIGLQGDARAATVSLVGAPPRGSIGKYAGHKYHHGHALILSGSAGRTGAARLAARGALRIGAGLVTVGAPPSAMDENAAQLTAIMLKQVRDAKALTEVLADTRINALCLGPGLGVGRDARALTEAALGAGRATVLDADALTSFADSPEALFAMLHATCVLTPHGGEFARLFPDLAEKLTEIPTMGPAYSRLDATRDAAARAGCVVLFKGPDTVIAAADGTAAISAAWYDRAAPWLATAGAGDVLAGILAGLLARGLAPMSAARAAVWLHVDCALKFGPGLIAEDLPDMLPQVLRDLGL
ncbi:NAD(P)H-hydrate dehydratase [Actibacterium sp. D379-3]